MREWLKKKWFDIVVRRILRRRVLKAGEALLLVNMAMVERHIPRKIRRQFFRDLWRRPVSAYEIIERGMYGKIAVLERK